jgi:hypothetical protein
VDRESALLPTGKINIGMRKRRVSRVVRSVRDMKGGRVSEREWKKKKGLGGGREEGSRADGEGLRKRVRGMGGIEGRGQGRVSKRVCKKR